MTPSIQLPSLILLRLRSEQHANRQLQTHWNRALNDGVSKALLDFETREEQGPYFVDSGVPRGAFDCWNATTNGSVPLLYHLCAPLAY